MEIFLINGGKIFLPSGDSVDVFEDESLSELLVIIFCKHTNPIMTISAKSVKKIIVDGDEVFKTSVKVRVERENE